MTSARVGPKSADVGRRRPNMAETRLTVAQICPKLAVLGQIRSDSNLAKVWLTRRKLEPTLAELGQIGALSGRISLKLGQFRLVLVKFGPDSTEFGHSCMSPKWAAGERRRRGMSVEPDRNEYASGAMLK